jgi:hypothetical protein
MGDKLATRADLEGLTAATAAITALTAQIAMLSNYLKNNNINANNSNVNNKFRRRQISMGTPSSSTRFTNTIPVSRKFEDFEKNVSKSKGFVNCVNLEIPSTTQKGSCVKNTTSSCEALLRGQAKIIMQMPPKKRDFGDSYPNFSNSESLWNCHFYRSTTINFSCGKCGP